MTVMVSGTKIENFEMGGASDYLISLILLAANLVYTIAS